MSVKAQSIESQLRTFYRREDVLLSFEMYHPTAADMRPEIDWSSMESYYRTAKEQVEFDLERYQWEERRR